MTSVVMFLYRKHYTRKQYCGFLTWKQLAQKLCIWVNVFDNTSLIVACCFILFTTFILEIVLETDTC